MCIGLLVRYIGRYEDALTQPGACCVRQVLKGLGFGQADGWDVDSLPGVPKSFAAFEDFDMGNFFDEDAATPAFAQHLRVGQRLGTGTDCAQLKAVQPCWAALLRHHPAAALHFLARQLSC